MHCPYLIVGGGMAANAAVRGIREVDPAGDITMIGAEPHTPYKRPPLSKDLWKGKSRESIWYPGAEDHAHIHRDTHATSIDAGRKTVTDADGRSYEYGKLLIATGGRPRRLPGAGDDIIYFRTVDDFDRLHRLCEQGGDVVVIGGGFIGAEISAALAMNGAPVTLVFPDDGVGGRMFPPALAGFLNDYYRERGVTVLSGRHVEEVRTGAGQVTVRTNTGERLSAKAVVAGLGIVPNTELAEAAGLAVDNGVVVDRFTATTSPDIYAAGDVANFRNPALDTRLRVEHEDNALTMGAVAGRNMAGRTQPYDHLPFFYSDLFDLGYEAVGRVDAGLQMVEDWREPYRKGVVYYLEGDRVRGVLLWNTWEQVDRARDLIAARDKVEPATLAGRIG
jgi:3-phenylpropionate/trans-cinnamate dioxygenase ferredoxin reductase component